MPTLVIACADVGSVARGNFAWWSSDGGAGHRPAELASHIANLLDESVPVALGFECPLFVPLATDEVKLTAARSGEGSRPWSAGAGCGALATGVVQVAWVLQRIRESLSHVALAHSSWISFEAAGSGLFLWEAFVSGTGKTASHVLDAQAGAEAFKKSLPYPPAANAVKCDGPVYSLLGAALLRSGWTTDISVLSEPCLVLRAC